MYDEDNILLQELKVTRNLRPATVTSYKYAIKSYTDYLQQSMTSLLEEAEQDELSGIRWKDRRIRLHLMGFRTYLLQQYSYYSTVHGKFNRILSVYRHYEIELQPLPPISTKSTKRTVIDYKDLPSKTIIKKAASVSDLQMRAVILFVASSGTARYETSHLTIRDFINATSDYHSSKDIPDVLAELDLQDDVIPTWRVHRQKTNKDYFTFSTPESTEAIVNYLLNSDRQLTPDSSLFDISARYLTAKFSRLNDRLGLGKVGSNRKFRQHMLRKFHATQLSTGINALTRTEIDSLQGRSKEIIHQSYYMDSPYDLKKKYINNIDKVTIFNTGREISEDSIEYQELLRKYNQLQEDIKEAARDEVKKILIDLGYDI